MSKARKPRTRTRPATRNGPAIPASEAGPVPAEPRAELAWGEDAAARVLRVLAERLESFLEGDELAFETLGERLEDEGFSGDDQEAAILALRRGGAPAAGAFESAAESTPEDAPGRTAQRVWSAEERASLSPEAWGFLLDLKRRGSLDDGQFERVLGILTQSGPGMGRGAWAPADPVGVELAREVAARVVLEREGTSEADDPHGETDPIH